MHHKDTYEVRESIIEAINIGGKVPRLLSDGQ